MGSFVEILSFEGGAKPAKKKRSLGIIIGVAVFAGVSTLGSTLAASVTIGSGPISFGQGVVLAVACDPSITVTPATSFVNTSGAGSFLLKTITVSGLDNATTNTTTGLGCGGKDLIIRAYGDSNATPLTLFGDPAVTDITSQINSTIGSTTANTGVVVSSTGTGILVYTITTPLQNATGIFKLTVEQQNRPS